MPSDPYAIRIEFETPVHLWPLLHVTFGADAFTFEVPDEHCRALARVWEIADGVLRPVDPQPAIRVDGVALDPVDPSLLSTLRSDETLLARAGIGPRHAGIDPTRVITFPIRFVDTAGPEPKR